MFQVITGDSWSESQWVQLCPIVSPTSGSIAVSDEVWSHCKTTGPWWRCCCGPWKLRSVVGLNGLNISMTHDLGDLGLFELSMLFNVHISLHPQKERVPWTQMFSDLVSFQQWDCSNLFCSKISKEVWYISFLFSCFVELCWSMWPSLSCSRRWWTMGRRAQWQSFVLDFVGVSDSRWIGCSHFCPKVSSARFEEKWPIEIAMGGSGSKSTESVDAVINSNDMVVFSSSSCPFCQRALAALKEAGYSPLVVESFDRGALASKCGGSTSVPKVFVKQNFIGGCNDGGMGGTLPLLKNGKIKELMGEWEDSEDSIIHSERNSFEVAENSWRFDTLILIQQESTEKAKPAMIWICVTFSGPLI